MSEYKSFEDEEEEKEGTGPEQPLQTSNQQAGAPAAAAATGSAAAPKGTRSGAGAFSNVKKFLDVNKNKLQSAAGRIGGALTGSSTRAGQNVDEGRDTATTGIEDAELVGLNNVETLSNEEILAQGGEGIITDEGYQGPGYEELNDDDAAATNISDDADAAIDRTRTEGGSAAAYRDQFGGRALTLAERAAFGQGGQLTQNLEGDRRTAAMRNIQQKQAWSDLQSEEGGGGYGGLINKQAGRALDIKKGLGAQVNANALALRKDIEAERDKRNLQRRDEFGDYKAGDHDREAYERGKIIERYKDAGYSHGQAVTAAQVEQTRRRKEAQYGNQDLTSEDILRLEGGSGAGSRSARAAALSKLAGITGEGYNITDSGIVAGGTGIRNLNYGSQADKDAYVDQTIADKNEAIANKQRKTSGALDSSGTARSTNDFQTNFDPGGLIAGGSQASTDTTKKILNKIGIKF